MEETSRPRLCSLLRAPLIWRRGQAISAASLENAHEKTNMLAAAFQKQQECIKVGIQPFLRTAVGFAVSTQTMQRVSSSCGLRC